MSDVAAPGPSHRRRRPSGEPPPLPRELNRAAIAWLIAFAFWAVIWVWVFVSDDPAVWITERDLELMGPIVDNRIEWLTPLMRRVNSIGSHWATPLVAWTTLILALWTRRIRHAALLIASLSAVAGAVNLVAREIGRPRPLGVEIIGDWEGFAQPSRPVALLTAALTACALSLWPSRYRPPWYWVSALAVAAFGFAQVYTGVDHPTDVFAGATVGVALTMLLYRTVAPERVFPIQPRRANAAHLDVTGPRGDAMRHGLRRQLDLEAVAITPVGLEGSAGSTPLRIDTASGECCFAKLYARSHLRSDRSYKLWRTLLYGRLEDEQPFASVRRLVQHEDYMLHVMQRVGVNSARPRGIVEITPDREYLLVCEHLGGAREIADVEISESIIDDGLAQIEALWRAGLAHRDIKPSNVMVKDGRVWLVDVAFAELRPSPWRQAVDLANMMLVLALGSSPEIVYERALLQFSEEEIAEAFAASRGVTLPSQLRRQVRQSGRPLVSQFRSLAPARPPVAIQRWSLRRLGLTAWVGLLTAGVVVAFVSNLSDIGLR